MQVNQHVAYVRLFFYKTTSSSYMEKKEKETYIVIS